MTLTTTIPDVVALETEKLLFNHVCATLSELDMEVVVNVPPGGNWANLPVTTVVKSARSRAVFALIDGVLNDDRNE